MKFNSLLCLLFCSKFFVFYDSISLQNFRTILALLQYCNNLYGHVNKAYCWELVICDKLVKDDSQSHPQFKFMIFHTFTVVC